MKFIGISLITEDVKKLVSFYERIFGVKSEGNEIHASMHVHGLDLSVYSRKASIEDMKFSYSADAGCGYTTLLFLVEDVDYEFEKLKNEHVDFLTVPTEYPWGTKAFHFKDPDGNIIDFVQRL